MLPSIHNILKRMVAMSKMKGKNILQIMRYVWSFLKNDLYVWIEIENKVYD